MINANQIPKITSIIDRLESNLSIFKNRVNNCSKIQSPDTNPEKEKSRILDQLKSNEDKLPSLLKEIKNIASSTDLKASDNVDPLKSLLRLEDSLTEIKRDFREITTNQNECQLEVPNQEINRTVDRILGYFNFIPLNIKHEISFLESFYRIPANASNTVIPELHDLVTDRNNKTITLRDFLFGYGSNQNRKKGYRELRSRNGIFSRFQSYENPPGVYEEINACLYEIRKTLEPFLRERKSVPSLGKFYYQCRDKNLKITRMNDIFHLESFFMSVMIQASKKDSYCDEVKKAKGLLEKFSNLRKSLIIYNDEEIENTKKALAKRFTQEEEKRKFSVIFNEIKNYLQDKSLPFDSLEIDHFQIAKKRF